MRTTLTLDDDVAVRLERLRKKRDASFKDIVNDAIRNGLEQIEAKPQKRKPFRTKAVDLGPLLFPSVKEALQALDEEEDRKKLGLL
ncbi:MAG TPA: CopG family transcriptional regulator [Rhizomicrobium sp.]|jgi:predicted transcriptional regulator|nr:CopG family transcriptional regulator [Rhizomicrobium sp.]